MSACMCEMFMLQRSESLMTNRVSGTCMTLYVGEMLMSFWLTGNSQCKNKSWGMNLRRKIYIFDA